MPLSYMETVDRRRALRIEGYKTLADVGFDGGWVTPYQITSRDPYGPVLVALHWLDEASIVLHRPQLKQLGYLPQIRFNRVLDLALSQAGSDRSRIYVTQAFHLVPNTRSERIPPSALDRSFDEVTRHELAGRTVVSLGLEASLACRRHGVPHIPACHPSRRGVSNQRNAAEIAGALIESMRIGPRVPPDRF